MMIVPSLALSLRLDTPNLLFVYGHSLLVYTGFASVVKLIVYYRFGMYKHLWRYASIEEVGVILISVLSAGFVFSVIYLVVLPLFPAIPQRIPRSVPLIDLMLSLLLHGGIRVMSRLYVTEQRRRVRNHDTSRRVLIVGAGNSGTMIAREMLRHTDGQLVPVAFVDDDHRKLGGVIHGLPVLGSRDAIPEICREYNIAQILIAMPSVSGRVIQSVLKIIEPLKVSTRILPSVSEIVGETVELSHLRSARIDDLLRRDPVKTDMSNVRGMLSGMRVMVTGAGGSIGGEICRLVAQCSPSELLLLGHGENSIHEISRELASRYPRLQYRTIVADIRDVDRIRDIFMENRPQVVYHAAAHKHVPLMEVNAIDAVSNNVGGTITMLRSALLAGVERFILISTDKAVQPRSIMGVTKRLAEIAVQLCAREYNAKYSAVRFGNVLGSRGSVVPIFQQQIDAGGPVTVTHPDMKRYFMTIPEAVQLVLQASTLEGNGEIYVLDMGEPVRIVDLAEDLIRLTGKEPYRDISIEFSGLRSGEKLSEALFRPGEVYRRSEHEKIFTILDPTFDESARHNGSARILASCDAFEQWVRSELLTLTEPAQILRHIHKIIPEFEHSLVGGTDITE